MSQTTHMLRCLSGKWNWNNAKTADVPESKSIKEECAERTEYITADEEKLETSDEKSGEESKQTPKECDMQRPKVEQLEERQKMKMMMRRSESEV